MSILSAITKQKTKEKVSSFLGFTKPGAKYDNDDDVLVYTDNKGALIEKVYANPASFDKLPGIDGSNSVSSDKIVTSLPHHGKKVASYQYLPPHLLTLMKDDYYYTKNTTPGVNDLDFAYYLGVKNKLSRIYYLSAFLNGTTISGATVQSFYFDNGYAFDTYNSKIQTFITDYNKGDIHKNGKFTSLDGDKTISADSYFRHDGNSTRTLTLPNTGTFLIYIEDGPVTIDLNNSSAKVVVISESAVTTNNNLNGASGQILIISPSTITINGNTGDINYAKVINSGNYNFNINGTDKDITPVDYSTLYKDKETAGTITRFYSNEVLDISTSIILISNSGASLSDRLKITKFDPETAVTADNMTYLAYRLIYQYGVDINTTAATPNINLSTDKDYCTIKYTLNGVSKIINIGIQTSSMEVVTDSGNYHPPQAGFLTESYFIDHHDEADMAQTYRVDANDADNTTYIVFGKGGKYMSIKSDGSVGVSPGTITFPNDADGKPVSFTYTLNSETKTIRPSSLLTVNSALPSASSITDNQGSDEFSSSYFTKTGDHISKYRKLVEITRNDAVVVSNLYKSAYEYVPIGGAVVEILNSQFTSTDSTHPLMRDYDLTNGVLTVRNTDPSKTTGLLVQARVKKTMKDDDVLYPSSNLLEGFNDKKSTTVTSDTYEITYADTEMIHFKFFKSGVAKKSTFYAIKKNMETTLYGTSKVTYKVVTDDNGDITGKLMDGDTSIDDFPLTDHGDMTLKLFYLFPSLVASGGASSIQKKYGGAMITYSSLNIDDYNKNEENMVVKYTTDEVPNIYLYDQEVPRSTLTSDAWDIQDIDFRENQTTHRMKRLGFDKTVKKTVSDISVYFLRKREVEATDVTFSKVPFPDASIDLGSTTKVFSVYNFNKDGSRKEISLSVDADGKIDRTLLPVFNPKSHDSTTDDYDTGDVIVDKVLSGQKRYKPMSVDDALTIIKNEDTDSRFYSAKRSPYITITSLFEQNTGFIKPDKILIDKTHPEYSTSTQGHIVGVNSNGKFYLPIKNTA